MAIFSAQELLSRHGITYIATQKKSYQTNCPSCGEGYCTVKVDNKGVQWFCHDCKDGGGEFFDQPDEPKGREEPRAVYDYQNEDGELLYQSLRFEPIGKAKYFRQRISPDQKKWSIKGARLVPFHLPKLIEAVENDEVIWIVEGEKDVLTLERHGIAATCNAMGAGKWKADYNRYFAGADVVICGDNDEPGRRHARQVASSLFKVARCIRLLDLKTIWQSIEESDDVSDWFARAEGASAAVLNEVAGHVAPLTEAPPWQDDVSAKANGADQIVADLGEWDAGDDPGPIPPREWLLANQFCCGYVSSLVGAGGSGKSALRLLQYISLALGRPLSGQHIFRRCRVLLISLEDDRNEVQRRIKAVLDRFQIDRADLKGWLYCATPKRAKLAELKGKERVVGDLERQIRAAIQRRKPALVALDPFVRLHDLTENDTGDMAFVCDLLVILAVENNIAVDIPHHVHKGQIAPGDADAGRGASGIRDATRLTYTLTIMSDEDAPAFNISAEDRRFYIRLDSAKVNIAPPSSKAVWFRLVGMPIGNATDQYPNGDTVQVVEPWEPPALFADLDNHGVNVILNDIDRGFYTADQGDGDRAAWKVVQKHAPKKRDSQCRQVIATWLKSGLLFKDEVSNKETGWRPVNQLKVDDAKRPPDRTGFPSGIFGGEDTPDTIGSPKGKPPPGWVPPDEGCSPRGDPGAGRGSPPRIRTRTVGNCPPDTVCIHCLQPGDVKKIKDDSVVGAKAETLHEGDCAQAWFGRLL